MCKFDKFHLTFNFKSKVSRDIFKDKNDCHWHLPFCLKCHLNVTCLVIHVILMFRCQWHVVFSLQVTLHAKIWSVRVNWRPIYSCSSLRVSNVKNLQKPCQNMHCKTSALIWVFSNSYSIYESIIIFNQLQWNSRVYWSRHKEIVH
jgi:hypothetical protein